MVVYLTRKKGINMYSMLNEIDKYIKKNGIPFNRISFSYTYLPDYINYVLLEKLRGIQDNSFIELGSSNYELAYDKNGIIYMKITSSINYNDNIVVAASDKIELDFVSTVVKESRVVEEACLYKTLSNYRKKVEFYLKEHSDKLSVYKLKNNKKLTETDLRELERILWTELGSKEDYIKEYGETPIGRLVRKIVGVDRAAVNEAFSCFMSEERLNINQMRFVNLIVDYIVANGNIEDNKVLMGEPFKSVGSITTLFKDDMSTAKQIMEIVNQIRRNSEEIA